MLKLMQVLCYMFANKMNDNEVLAELNEIVDNGRSDLFELSDNDIQSICNVFYDDEKFESAWSIAKLKSEGSVL